MCLPIPPVAVPGSFVADYAASSSADHAHIGAILSRSGWVVNGYSAGRSPIVDFLKAQHYILCDTSSFFPYFFLTFQQDAGKIDSVWCTLVAILLKRFMITSASAGVAYAPHGVFMVKHFYRVLRYLYFTN